MRVLIRADASPTIGSGHIARCLTLARVLRQQGSHVAFACRRLPGHRLDALARRRLRNLALPDVYPDEDPQQAIESMLPWQADIAALGALLAATRRSTGSSSTTTASIITGRPPPVAGRHGSRQWTISPRARYSVDLLLNQNLSGPSAGVRAAAARRTAGPCSARAMPCCAKNSSARPLTIKPQARRVLVNFGGFDAAMQTHHAMLALADFRRAGSGFRRRCRQSGVGANAGTGGDTAALAPAQFRQRFLPR